MRPGCRLVGPDNPCYSSMSPCFRQVGLFTCSTVYLNVNVARGEFSSSLTDILIGTNPFLGALMSSGMVTKPLDWIVWLLSPKYTSQLVILLVRLTTQIEQETAVFLLSTIGGLHVNEMFPPLPFNVLIV